MTNYEYSRQSKTTTITDNIEKMREILLKDQRIKIKVISKDVGTPKDWT